MPPFQDSLFPSMRTAGEFVVGQDSIWMVQIYALEKGNEFSRLNLGSKDVMWDPERTFL